MRNGVGNGKERSELRRRIATVLAATKTESGRTSGAVGLAWVPFSGCVVKPTGGVENCERGWAGRPKGRVGRRRTSA